MFVFLVNSNVSLFQVLAQFPFKPGENSCICDIFLSSLIEELLSWVVLGFSVWLFFLFET